MEIEIYQTQKRHHHHHRHCDHFDQKVIHRAHHKKPGKSNGPPSRGELLTIQGARLRFHHHRQNHQHSCHHHQVQLNDDHDKKLGKSNGHHHEEEFLPVLVI